MRGIDARPGGEWDDDMPHIYDRYPHEEAAYLGRQVCFSHVLPWGDAGAGPRTNTLGGVRRRPGRGPALGRGAWELATASGKFLYASETRSGAVARRLYFTWAAGAVRFRPVRAVSCAFGAPWKEDIYNRETDRGRVWPGDAPAVGGEPHR